jgi:DNA polymerase
MAQSNPDCILAPLSALQWLVEAGADEAVGDEPVNRFNHVAVRSGPDPFEAASSPLPPRPSAAHPRNVPARPAAPAASKGDQIGCAMEIAAACGTLAELKAALEAFEGCPLKKHATRTVFADGTPERGILFIGEAPGKEEDLAGLPFVGRAGKLLDRMMASIGLDRRSNVYITNVLNWRPPSNRDPTPEEAAICLPFLRRHIELAAPNIIVLLGAIASRHIMGRSEGIMRLRGSWLEYFVCGRMVPVMPTLHPAYLLRRPIDKKLAWRDLQAISVKIQSLALLEKNAGSG